MSLTNKLVVAALVGVTVLSSVTVFNQVAGEEVVVGAPYRYAYSVCDQWYTDKLGRRCLSYKPAYETRVEVEVHGVFWNTTGYKIVR
jgi:hypothetical protein